MASRILAINCKCGYLMAAPLLMVDEFQFKLLKYMDSYVLARPLLLWGHRQTPILMEMTMTAYATASRTASFRFFKGLPSIDAIETVAMTAVALLIAASINAML
ncbi:hypothetical protein [Nitrospirillum amazonense]|nr:hypothetical protein [Nitrospirillum amazonense]MDG3442084.1 hypothetical protein [Nitrospirillum amazonense]